MWSAEALRAEHLGLEQINDLNRKFESLFEAEWPEPPVEFAAWSDGTRRCTWGQMIDHWRWHSRRFPALTVFVRSRYEKVK